jgi:hypothetical protein
MLQRFKPPRTPKGQQTALLAAPGAVEPLDLRSGDLARSGIRLFEVTHA